MRAVGSPQLGDTQTGNTCRGELTLSVNNCNLLIEGHTRHSVVDTSLNFNFGVEVVGKVSGLSLSATTRCQESNSANYKHFVKKSFHLFKVLFLVKKNSYLLL